MIEVVDISDNKIRKILSAGKSRFGLLGQGEEIKEASFFKEIKVNFMMAHVIHIELSARHGMALTKEGTLYGWG